MKRIIGIILLLGLAIGTYASPRPKYVKIETSKGSCVIRLYNETPKHRDNFVKLVKKRFYNGLLFHRVIEGFMIQGGDPDSRSAKAGQLLGEGDLGYKVPSEFSKDLFHKKGALAAARDDNPEKSSSASQFYLVQGKVYNDEELDRSEEKRLQGYKIPQNHRNVYKTQGGSPFLDQQYTVFGEVVKGLEMIDSIASIETDNYDRPLTDVSMRLTLLKRRDIRALEKELLQQSYRDNVRM